MSAHRHAAKLWRVAGEPLDSRASGLKPMNSSHPSTVGSLKALIPPTCKTRGHFLKLSPESGGWSKRCHRAVNAMTMIFWQPQDEAELAQMA